MQKPHLYAIACFLCKLLSQCQGQVATKFDLTRKICVTQCHATGLGPGFPSLPFLNRGGYTRLGIMPYALPYALP